METQNQGMPMPGGGKAEGPAIRFCPNCGAPQQDEGRFCAVCGQRLLPDETQPAVTAPATVAAATPAMAWQEETVTPPSIPVAAPAAEPHWQAQSPQAATAQTKGRSRGMVAAIVAAAMIAVAVCAYAVGAAIGAHRYSVASDQAEAEIAALERVVSQAQSTREEAERILSADDQSLVRLGTELNEARAILTSPDRPNVLFIWQTFRAADQATKRAESARTAKTTLSKTARSVEKTVAAEQHAAESLDADDSADARGKLESAHDQALPPSVDGLRTYRNARFGYSVAIPDSYKWGKESDDGASRSFTDTSGRITVSVSGENNTSGATPESLQSAMAAGHSDITYQTHGENFAVVSYYENGKGIYIKKFVNAGTIATLHLQWPADLTDSVGGPLTEQTEDSFRPGNSTAS
ncbi:zinc ribbon domain-containing protein [Bifidobacterium pullorum subsp. saeculare]|uniref:Zinc ribbon domain-containing protein n=1 Tax=Bifidobacterium pullorum subsp. saeculare TaxID=78257 RepID=A0A938WXC2_9BIFI|nr:zinc ribbon domain-containing protein [Bifidobacterium pullorum]MBM6699300.1 zinc ribbon domain-containing protein [Bifidobacterium pullorum subsp. saeculare]